MISTHQLTKLQSILLLLFNFCPQNRWNKKSFIEFFQLRSSKLELASQKRDDKDIRNKLLTFNWLSKIPYMSPMRDSCIGSFVRKNLDRTKMKSKKKRVWNPKWNAEFSSRIVHDNKKKNNLFKRAHSARMISFHISSSFYIVGSQNDERQLIEGLITVKTESINREIWAIIFFCSTNFRQLPF